MNNTISEFLKKLTICTMVLIFTFILLAPTADALNYDPKNRKTVLAPSGDDDPLGVDKVNDPNSNDNYQFMSDIKTGLISYLYFTFGWNSNSNWKNFEIDVTPSNNDNITYPDDSENDSKQTKTNR